MRVIVHLRPENSYFPQSYSWVVTAALRSCWEAESGQQDPGLLLLEAAESSVKSVHLGLISASWLKWFLFRLRCGNRWFLFSSYSETLRPICRPSEITAAWTNTGVYRRWSARLRGSHWDVVRVNQLIRWSVLDQPAVESEQKQLLLTQGSIKRRTENW